MTAEQITPAFRCALAIRLIGLMRGGIQKNEGRYDGSYIPNLSSVTNALTCPAEELLVSLKHQPPSLVNLEHLEANAATLETMWKGE